MDKNTLTRKQKIFIEAYLRTWNGTGAAREAGFAWPDRAAYRLLHMRHIQAAVQARLDESAMRTDEILARLSEEARINISVFFVFEEIEEKDDQGQVHKRLLFAGMNWENFRRYGHLVKSLSWTRSGLPILTLHDGQNALVQLGRSRGLFTDRMEVNSENVDVIFYIPSNGRENNNPTPDGAAGNLSGDAG
jgi:hypothetical protein